MRQSFSCTSRLNNVGILQIAQLAEAAYPIIRQFVLMAQLCVDALSAISIGGQSNLS